MKYKLVSKNNDEFIFTEEEVFDNMKLRDFFDTSENIIDSESEKIIHMDVSSESLNLVITHFKNPEEVPIELIQDKLIGDMIYDTLLVADKCGFSEFLNICKEYLRKIIHEKSANDIAKILKLN